MNENLFEILAAREDRAAKQKQLLCQFQKPLLCFTMNIPGPEKWNRDIAIGFFVGSRMLLNALGSKLCHWEERVTSAGGEGYFVCDMPVKELKQLAVDLEEAASIGRLFDMDVLDIDGRKLQQTELGHPPRTCLLCDNQAAICASRRAHRLEELTERVGFLLYLTARQDFAEYIAVNAYFALNREVSTTPKPGLVDKNNQGSHPDMDIRHFFVSANALRPYFCRFAETGYLTRDLSPAETFARIREIGKEAETAMLAATRGVNTHKGAIFSLGLLCAAAGRLSPADWQPERLLAECAAMTKGITEKDFAGITLENAKTAGEKLYAQYGIAGVRGQAEAGFPAVKNVGLPVFRQALEKGLSVNDAGCIALLHLIAATDDTNLIHRSDRQTQLQIKAKIAALLEKDPFPAMSVIEQLDQEFIQKNLSPGGSADLLAVTYFLQFLN